MGINGRTSLDPRWTRHHTPVAVGFMLATIKVIRKSPVDGAMRYNGTTGTYSGATFTTIVENVQARIQPFGIIGDMVVGQDSTSRRLMRVQIENVQTSINLDDHIEVTSCPDNPELKNYTLEVRGAISSSNAWLTDLVAEANTKSYV